MNQDTSNMYRGDNTNSNQNQALSSTNSNQQQRFNSSTSNRSRGNQNDRQHNNSNIRRSSNYNNNRNNNRNRQAIDPNISSSNTISNSNRDNSSFVSASNMRSNNYHNRSNNGGGHRYDQGGVHYGNNSSSNNNRSYEQRSNNNQPSSLIPTQPPLNESILNSMDEFPSLDDSTLMRAKTLAPENFIYSPQSSINTTPLVISSSNNNIGYSAPNTSGNYHNPYLQQQQQQHHHPNQHHSSRHYNNRRGGGGGGYNKNSNTRENHNNSTKNNNYRSSNASSSTTVPQHQMSQHGSSNSRSRNNRRSTNNVSNYDHNSSNRRNQNRDYAQLPQMMNGIRIGMNHHTAINTIPIPYITTTHTNPYQSQLLPTNITTQPKGNSPGAAGTAGGAPSTSKDNIQILPNLYSNKIGPYLPGESPHDLLEAERYKSVTMNAMIPKEEQIRNQIEFYFSNTNLKNDAFLRTQMDEQGWVDIEVILKFNRISKFQINKEYLVSIVMTTNRLECKTTGSVTKIRRAYEPEKWTSHGLELQKHELYQAYPELEHMVLDPLPTASMGTNMYHHHHPTTTNGTNMSSSSASSATATHIQPMSYSIPINRYTPHSVGPHPSFMGGYVHPQVALNYGIYPIDDINGTMGLVYDPTLPVPFEVSATNYQDMMLNNNHNMTTPNNISIATATNTTVVTNLSNTPNDNERYTMSNDGNVSSLQNDDDDDDNDDNDNDDSTLLQTTVESSTTKKDKNLTLSQENNSDFQLDDNEYKELFVNFIDERNTYDITKNVELSKKIELIANRLYRYWTHCLVLKFDQDKYDCFRKVAVEDAKKQKRDGITMLYQFYERFLHRYPFSVSYNDNVLSDQKKDTLLELALSTSSSSPSNTNELSAHIFDDFQNEAFDDYNNNECVAGLKKLVRFNNQFSNPSRQTPPFKRHIQQLIRKLSLNDSNTSSSVMSFTSNNDISHSTKTDHENDQSIVSPSKDNSTHH